MSSIRLPGLIDLHTHLRTPGQTQKEDFTTGTKAALAGGFTTIFDMPNNSVPITTAERLNEKIALAKDGILCDVGFYFGSVGDNLDEFEKVKHTASGLKLYLNQTTGGFLLGIDLLEKVFEAWKNPTPILVHAEEQHVKKVIDVVRKTKRKTHICHISLASELVMIQNAKEEGLPITCGVTPHHLFLAEEDGKHLGPFGQMKPPLSTKKDVAFLWKNIGAIDVMESDHAPHTKDEKNADKPPYGVPGLETTLPLLLTAVSEKRLTIEETIRLCHTGPATILGLPTDQETHVEVDLETSYQINNENLFTKCKWSPFDGWTMKGKVIRVFLHEEKVFEDGEILAKSGSGSVLMPSK